MKSLIPFATLFVLAVAYELSESYDPNRSSDSDEDIYQVGEQWSSDHPLQTVPIGLPGIYQRPIYNPKPLPGVYSQIENYGVPPASYPDSTPKEQYPQPEVHQQPIYGDEAAIIPVPSPKEQYPQPPGTIIELFPTLKPPSAIPGIPVPGAYQQPIYNFPAPLPGGYSDSRPSEQYPQPPGADWDPILPVQFPPQTDPAIPVPGVYQQPIYNLQAPSPGGYSDYRPREQYPQSPGADWKSIPPVQPPPQTGPGIPVPGVYPQPIYNLPAPFPGGSLDSRPREQYPQPSGENWKSISAPMAYPVAPNPSQELRKLKAIRAKDVDEARTKYYTHGNYNFVIISCPSNPNPGGYTWILAESKKTIPSFGVPQTVALAGGVNAEYKAVYNKYREWEGRDFTNDEKHSFRRVGCFYGTTQSHIKI